MIFIVALMIQREELRARFPGVPGDLVNYFLYVAEEVLGHSLVSDFLEPRTPTTNNQQPSL